MTFIFHCLQMSIHVIVGPMGAGKTSALIKQMRKVPQNKTIMLKHTQDTRFSSNNEIVSRDGLRAEAVSIKELSISGTHLFGSLFDKLTTIGVDEGQFFRNIASCAHQWALKGKHVIIAAIQTGIFLEPISHISELLSIADSITILKNQCIQCGASALFNYRKTPLAICPDNDPIMAYYGDMSEYAPVCRRCFHKRLEYENGENIGFHSSLSVAWQTIVSNLLKFDCQLDPSIFMPDK